MDKSLIEAYEECLKLVDDSKFTNLSKGIGTNIHAKGVGLGFALTNPTLTDKFGRNRPESYYNKGTVGYRKLFRSKPFTIDGLDYKDVEDAYQCLKTGDHRHDNALMFTLITYKFTTYPELYHRVIAKGGIDYLYDCIHQPVNKRDWYYTNGGNGFMKILIASFIFIKQVLKK